MAGSRGWGNKQKVQIPISCAKTIGYGQHAKFIIPQNITAKINKASVHLIYFDAGGGLMREYREPIYSA